MDGSHLADFLLEKVISLWYGKTFVIENRTNTKHLESQETLNLLQEI